MRQADSTFHQEAYPRRLNPPGITGEGDRAGYLPIEISLVCHWLHKTALFAEKSNKMPVFPFFSDSPSGIIIMTR